MYPNRSTRGSGFPGRLPSQGYSNSYPSTDRSSSRRPPLFQPTRMQASLRDPRQSMSARAEPETTSSNPSQGRQSTVIRPGQPHIHGLRTNRELVRVEMTLCRCQNPNSHGDAFTVEGGFAGTSITGQPLNYQQAWTAALDHYGKDSISHVEERAADPFIFDPATVVDFAQYEQRLTLAVRLGMPLKLRQDIEITHHNQDGHSRPHVTGEGLRTTIDRSGYSRPEQNSTSVRGAAPSRGRSGWYGGSR